MGANQPDPVLLAIDALAARLDRLQALLTELLRRTSTHPTDKYDRLLCALVGACGSEPFAASDALEYAGVRAVAPHMTPIGLGKVLRNIEGRTIGGRRVEQVSAGVWRIVEVIEVTSRTPAA